MTSKLKTDILETVSGSGTIALTNQLSGMTDASMPSGSVVQVIQLYGPRQAGQFTTTSSSFAATGLIAEITPKYSGSKILICWNNTMAKSNGDGSARMYMRIGSGSYAAMAGTGQYHIGYSAASTNQYAPHVSNSNYVTTNLSTLYFQPYIRADSNTYTFMHSDSSYALTLTEIKG